MNLTHSQWCPIVAEQDENAGCNCGAEKAEQERLATIRDALRWRWWCKWWLDAKDDCERVNSLDYEDEESMGAAIDAEIAKDNPEQDNSP